MDRELRELERRAAQGDPDALYRLLIRLHSLGNFELSDINQEARSNMALALLRTLPSSSAKADIFVQSDPSFVPGHSSVLECPLHAVGCSGSPDNFTYHYLSWQSLDCFQDDEDIYVSHDSVQEDILDTTLYCPKCDSSWRINSGDIEFR